MKKETVVEMLSTDELKSESDSLRESVFEDPKNRKGFITGQGQNLVRLAKVDNELKRRAAKERTEADSKALANQIKAGQEKAKNLDLVAKRSGWTF
jgi:hypothetical protein